MAAATMEKKSTGNEDLVLALYDGETPLRTVLEKVSEQALALAWTRGEIEFGTTKYVIAGNPEWTEATHNGVVQAKPSVVIEGGIEWSGPRQRWHGRVSDIRKETLPISKSYQKYQQEVCVNKQKDVWEWLEDPAGAKGRDTRWARREIDRAEAEKLFDHYVRLTEKGLAVSAA